MGCSVKRVGLENFPQKGPGICVGNHEPILAAMALVAALPRDDVLVAAQDSLPTAVPEQYRTLFVPFRSHGEPGDLWGKILSRCYHFVFPLGLTRIDNKKSIQVVTKHIDNGGILVFLPTHGEPIKYKWRHGLARIINGLEDPGRTKLVNCDAAGVSYLDLVRILPCAARTLPTAIIRVNFFDAHTLENYSGKQARELSKQLHDEYCEKRPKTQ